MTHLDPVILTLNAGSSSLKFAAFALVNGAEPKLLASGQIEGIGAAAEAASRRQRARKATLTFDLGRAYRPRGRDGRHLGWLRKAGYEFLCRGGRPSRRAWRPGPRETDSDRRIRARGAEALVPLAPLHEPHNLAGILAAMKAFPSVPQVACFDTAFHRDHPFVDDTFALPRSYYDEGVRRYGFHGLSYEFIARKLRKIAPQVAREDVVVAHLGNGASMCAVRDGRAVASTMGFTALDGLPMGTRCGQLDPGVVLYLMAEKKMSVDEISDLLWKNSGLKGMSGVSHDMRELEASESPAARDAIAYFVSRIRRELAGLAATVDGVEAVVFTAGIGEHSWKVREAVLNGMEWMGIHLDVEANRANAQIISAKHSPTIVFIIPTDEERMIAEHTIATAGLANTQR